MLLVPAPVVTDLMRPFIEPRVPVTPALYVLHHSTIWLIALRHSKRLLPSTPPSPANHPAVGGDQEPTPTAFQVSIHAMAGLIVRAAGDAFLMKLTAVPRHPPGTFDVEPTAGTRVTGNVGCGLHQDLLAGCARARSGRSHAAELGFHCLLAVHCCHRGPAARQYPATVGSTQGLGRPMVPTPPRSPTAFVITRGRYPGP
jgi:hypothetical protein